MSSKIPAAQEANSPERSECAALSLVVKIGEGKHILKNQQGAAALLTVFLTLTIFIVTLAGGIVFVFNERQISRNVARGLASYYVSEGGIEDAVYRVVSGKQYSSNYNVTIGANTTNVTISGDAVKTVTATTQADPNNVFKNVRATLTYSTVNPQFYYGVQVGEGGVAMGENSKIQGAGGGAGNFYSNGPVEGDNGSTITGDVTVATGVALDSQHIVYNADFSFGTSIGSTITIVDSTGDVGEYGALAIGSDGFARISYHDASNKDLKFARCINADCTAKNITILDSGGDVGWRYTSIGIATDGFARVSFYDNTNDDLKYIRCLNDDCTSKVVTVVDSSGDVGQFSSLIIGSDGLARISYYSISAGDLKFAQCLNADCSAKNITAVDSSGDVGKYTSIALASDLFARISYYDETNDDLKFARCINADCSSRNVTTIDSGGDVGQYKSSIVIGSDDFARISYFDDTNDDLKFVRCANADCATKNIAIVDSSGQVGKYNSLKFGPDGFGRISYYDAGNGAVKFARCTNSDCTASILSSVDSAGDAGHYTSLGLGPDGFARISYYDNSNKDLKYARCSDVNCPPSLLPGDAAQSFIPAQSEPLAKVSLYLKKVGNPSGATIRINADNAGEPATSSLASVSLNANLVETNYGWIDVAFSSPPSVTSGTTYWLVFDGNQDAANYYVWGYDNTNGYANGVAKYSEDWSSKPWFLFNGDMNFKTYVGTGLSSIDGAIVYGTVRANNITDSKICGDAYYKSAASIDSSSKNFLDSPTNPACGGNPLTPGTGYPDQSDPPVSNMPISQANIEQWKADGAAGGTIAGNYSATTDVSLGPKKITGDLLMTSSNKTLTVTGTIYVQGNIDISNGSKIKCAASFGVNSCVVAADGWIHASNNGVFSGSGEAGSYVMLLTTVAGCNGGGQQSQCTHHNSAIDLHNNATGAIFYASNSMANLHNGVNVTGIIAYKLELGNNAVVTYEQGLVNAQFSAGPGASFDVSNWQEIP